MGAVRTTLQVGCWLTAASHLSCRPSTRTTPVTVSGMHLEGFPLEASQRADSHYTRILPKTRRCENPNLTCGGHRYAWHPWSVAALVICLLLTVFVETGVNVSAVSTRSFPANRLLGLRSRFVQARRCAVTPPPPQRSDALAMDIMAYVRSQPFHTVQRILSSCVPIARDAWCIMA